MMTDNLVQTVGKTSLYVVDGDITRIRTPAIMTAINSKGMWFGGIDGAIQRVAGDHYHAQAQARMPLRDLQTIVAKGQLGRCTGEFTDVVFVVDDLKSPLNQVIYAGLEAAHQERYDRILVPAIRMGVMAGQVEKTAQETVRKLGLGIAEFMRDYGMQTALSNITFVAYRDPVAVRQLCEGLATAKLN